MNIEVARALIRSLLQRLSHQGTQFTIPDGRLSKDEVAALAMLGGIEMPVPEAIQQPTNVSPSALLDLGALGRKGPPEDKIRLCLDFGTAMSKAWATGNSVESTIPLILGRPASGQNTLTVPSSVFIASSGRIFLGVDAERQQAAEAHLGRLRFDNIKRLLSEVQPGVDLDEVALEPGIDPIGSGLTKGDLLVLYLAWLTDMALRALGEALAGRSDAFITDSADIRAIRRRFAIPCFENAVDEEPNHKRAQWAESVMDSVLKRAQIVADTLAAEWNSLTVGRAKAVLYAARNRDLTKLDQLLTTIPAIREPVAAGASQFGERFAHRETGGAQVRRLMLVIDSGAGTTDYALFQAADDRRTQQIAFALVSSSVRMSRIAGNRFDAVLRPLVLEACKIDPAHGAPLSPEDFAIVNADLSAQIRGIKQQLFRTGRAIISLRPAASGTLDISTVQANADYRELGIKLLDQRRELLEKTLSDGDVERYRRTNLHLGHPIPIYVVLTGGSASLPPIQALAGGSIDIRGAEFTFQLVTDLPSWVRRLPRETSELVAREFSQCAVSIGGSAPNLPLQQEDLAAPVTPTPQTRWQLDRYQVTGVH